MSSELRRSERIFILESKKAHQAVNEKKRDMSLVSTEGQSSQRQRRKKSKVNNTSSNRVTNSVEDSRVSTETPLPQASSLHLLLNILKRRDTREIFAEPVNAAEVIGYNNIVKEPMDFATISTKLSNEEYKVLEQFEHDIFLVFSNAMLFNASNTIYYRQARAIRKVAKKLFTALRADTNMFEIKFALPQFGDKWTKAEARLINSIDDNNSEKLAPAGKGAIDAEGLPQTENTHDLWTSYSSEEEAPLAGNDLSGTYSGSTAWGSLLCGGTLSVPEFDGGRGSVAQPTIDESNYGALTQRRTPPPPSLLHVGDHQQVSNMGNQLMFEQPDHRALSLFWQAPPPHQQAQPILENPDHRALARWQPHSHQLSNMVARPNLGRNDLGASLWNAPTHQWLQAWNQEQDSSWQASSLHHGASSSWQASSLHHGASSSWQASSHHHGASSSWQASSHHHGASSSWQASSLHHGASSSWQAASHHHGASSSWQASSHHHLQVGQQQLPETVSQPRLDGSDYGVFSFWQAPPIPQVQVPDQQQMPSAAYHGSVVSPTADANPSGNNANVPDQNANAANPEDPSAPQGDIMAEYERMSPRDLFRYMHTGGFLSRRQQSADGAAHRKLS